MSVAQGAVLAAEKFPFFPVRPREDGFITVQLGLRVHQARVEDLGFLSATLKEKHSQVRNAFNTSEPPHLTPSPLSLLF